MTQHFLTSAQQKVAACSSEVRPSIQQERRTKTTLGSLVAQHLPPWPPLDAESIIGGKPTQAQSRGANDFASEG